MVVGLVAVGGIVVVMCSYVVCVNFKYLMIRF